MRSPSNSDSKRRTNRDKDRKKSERRSHKSSRIDRDDRDKDRREKYREKDGDSRVGHSRKEKTRSRSRSRSPIKSNVISHKQPLESSKINLTLGSGNRNKIGFNSKSTHDRNSYSATPNIFDPQVLEGKSQEEIDMLTVMGFSGFDSTKNKHVEGAANASALNVQEKRRYRQYMNRKGGFNRPLDPVA
jgi:U4/U6.U5 tri-snRNP-associated protein 3